jgi:hypothetical protein
MFIGTRGVRYTTFSHSSFLPPPPLEGFSFLA